MKVSISMDKVHFTLPIPMALVSIIGPIVIRNLSSKKLSWEIKSLILESFAIIIDNLKECKGMTLVDVETSKGEKVLIKI